MVGIDRIGAREPMRGLGGTNLPNANVLDEVTRKQPMFRTFALQWNIVASGSARGRA
jgi:hypothetical protein